jgi:hypothetical protein
MRARGCLGRVDSATALLLPDFIGAETTRPRLVAARVTALEFIPKAGSRNQ